ncbi:MAG: hypothetical protein J5758_05715, partial [Abditibacteriota bacterium]|nr:hypothetical protein [Abditibacteriota bacterium]
PIAPYAVGIKDGFRGNDWRKVSGGDSFFSDIVLCNLYCGIEAIRGGSVYSGIHMWNAFPTSYDSYFARLHRGGFIQMNGIFLDTLKYGFYSDSQSDLCVLLSNMSWLSVRDDNNAKTVFGFNANTRYNVSGVFLKEEGSGTAAATANLSGSVFSNVLTYGTVAGLNYLPS